MSFDLKSIVDEVVLDEMTTTGNVEGYNTPFAFTSGRKKDKKKNKRISTNSTGYKVVKESVDNRDFKLIQLLIRDEVADIFKRLWIRRSAWKN